MKTHIVVLTIMLANLMLCVRTYTQDTVSGLSQKGALALIRAVNTSEASVFAAKRQYGPLEALLSRGAFLGHQSAPTATDSVTASLKENYRLSVVASADGQHYAIQLVPTAGCAVAFFSSETAVIYTASALGCPQIGAVSDR